MKFKVDSWVDKPPDYTGKWYRCFVPDANLSIIESELSDKLIGLFYLISLLHDAC